MTLTEGKIAEINEILNKMNEEGKVAGGLLKIDGTMVKTTLALNDIAPTLISRIANISDALLREVGDKQKEIEMTSGSDTLVIVRIGNYLFFGLAKSKEDKKTIIDYAKKLESVL
ncbi:MAG: hypothetical protein QW153_01765 [Candidatus Bilamarchaeaceae archaeon]